ncbi:MAG: hypothetical protein KF691_15850 [Phycisphaeraceae bacterium]|nr:hypothetical protein [Phycisphaeraceae bacterium]
MAIFSGQAKHKATSALVGFIAFVTSMTVLWLAVPRPAFERVVWDAKDGSPVPDGFCFVMFPSTSHVDLFDAPNGKGVAVLDRAIICTQQELLDKNPIPVQTAGGARYLRPDDVTAAIPMESMAMVGALESRFTTQDRALKLSRLPIGGPTERFALRDSDLKHARSMVYMWDVVNGAPTAREIRRSDIGTAINRVFFTAVLAVVSILIGALASNLYNRRARLAHEKAPALGAV